MIADYRITDSVRTDKFPAHSNNNFKREEIMMTEPSNNVAGSTASPKIIFSSFINHIDAIQNKFSCCGIESAKDWAEVWDGYIAPSCCSDNVQHSTNPKWSDIFKVDESYEFRHCNEDTAHQLGCLVSLKEDEHSKYSWLGDLLIVMIIATVANTIFSMLLFGLNKTENDQHDANEHELSIVGVSDKPRSSQPTITSIKPRLSVVQTLGQETISNRAQAVRFNLSPSPTVSKFSSAARRGSSFL